MGLGRGEEEQGKAAAALFSPRGVFVAGLSFVLGLPLTFSSVSECVASRPHPQFLIPPILIRAEQPRGLGACPGERALLSSEPSKPYRGEHLEVTRWQVSLGNSSQVCDARLRVSRQAPRKLSSAL